MNTRRTIEGAAALFAAVVITGCAGAEGPDTLTKNVTWKTSYGAVEASCQEAIIGGADVCEPTADWKAAAGALCEAAGMTLESVGYADKCGTGYWRRAKVTCCGTPVPPDEGDGSTDGEDTSGGCQNGLVGAPSECRTAATLKAEAADWCGAGMAVSDIGYAGACGEGSWNFAKFSCCPSDDPAPAEPCVTQVVGDGQACRDDQAWKAHLGDLCAAGGQVVTDVGYSQSCGDQAWAYAKVTCCDGEPAPPADPAPEPPPAADPAPAGCKAKVFGDGSCRPSGDWTQDAAAYCSADAMEVTDVSYAQSCGAGSYRYAQVTCCVVEPTAPPLDEDGCFGGSLGGHCGSAAEWKAEASAICGDHGMTVAALGVSGPCEAGRWSSAKYKCCAPEAEPPAPPAPPAPPEPVEPEIVCSSEVLGAHDTCTSEETWHKMADGFCGKQDADLEDLVLHGSCGDGFYNFARVRCCGEEQPPVAPAVVCETETIGDEGTCRSASDWKAAADEICDEDGGTITALGVNTQCEPGKWAKAKMTCCVEPEPEPAPAPAPEDRYCEERTIDTGGFCAAGSVIRTKTAAMCAADGLVVESFAGVERCGAASFTVARVTCCEPAAAACTWSRIGNMTSCQDAAQLVAKARAICQSQDATLSHYAVQHPCGDTGARVLGFTCCP